MVVLPAQHLLQWLYPDVLVGFVGLDHLLVRADNDGSLSQTSEVRICATISNHESPPSIAKPTVGT